jgi:hypothetical protein
VDPDAFSSIGIFLKEGRTVVNRNKIGETLNAVHQFNIRGFDETLKPLITKETVLQFFPFVVVVVGPSHNLYKLVWKTLRDNIAEIVKTKGFLNLKEDSLQVILKDCGLKIEEIDLFHGYLKWIDRRCAENGLNIADEKARKYFKHLNLIRFPLMSLKQFNEGPGKINLLSENDKKEIISFISEGRKTSFITWKRIGLVKEIKKSKENNNKS